MRRAPAARGRGCRLRHAFGFVLLVAATVAIDGFAAERPPQAQQAFERGFQMARKSQWPLAIRYFRQAQSFAPTDGAILFNLALAHDKAGGEELLAMAWYQAFLAAEPDAPTGPQVRKRVVDLEVAADVQIQHLLATAQQAAAQIIDKKEAAQALDRMARAEAESGDLVAAERTVQRAGDPNRVAWALAVIAAQHAYAGNVERGVSQAKSIKAATARSWALAEVAVARAKRGDFVNAVAMVDAIAIAREKAWAQSRIAALQSRAGDVSAAKALIDTIAKTQTGPRSIALAALAGAQSKSGLPWATDAAKPLLVEAVTLAEAVTDLGERAQAFALIARAYAEAGDTQSAAGMLSRISDGPDLYRARRAVAEAEGAAGSAGIYRWTAVAVKAELNPQAGNTDSLLRSTQGQAPAQVVMALAKAAEERARVLRALRSAN